MAKRKHKRKRKRSVAHLKRYQFRKKGSHMAKRRRTRKVGRARRVYRAVRRVRRRAHRAHHGSGGSGLAAIKHDAPRMIAGAIYGRLEASAKADANHMLNKVPKPITAIGYTGNIALALYAASMFVRHPYVRLGASVVATIATYKMGVNGKAFEAVTLSGEDFLEGDEQMIDAHAMGALEAEGHDHTTQPGLRYDDVVQQAGARV